jgi:autotransporter-associated beta strand protein/T5SS/PEP-CTERM-associated repeat protein
MFLPKGILSLLGILVLVSGQVSGTEWKYQAGNPPADQDWNNASNWLSGVPGGGFFIRNIHNDLFPIIDNDLAATANGNSFIGAFSATNSRLDIRSGSLSINGTLLVGPDNPSGATLNLANTAILDAGNLSGFAIGSGSLSTTGAVTLARRNNATATLNINTTGSFSVSGENQILVGGGGTATVNLVNGSFNTVHFAGGLVLGGLSDQNDDNGSPSKGNGTFNMSGGSIGDGTTSKQRFIRVGRDGTGTFNQSGGSVNLANNMIVGENAGSTGTVNFSGGTTSIDIIRVGVTGSGTLNISGSAAVSGRNFNDALVLGVNSGGEGTVNLNGGSLTLRSVKGGSGSSTFNFNGGTLVFTSFFADAFQGLSAAHILAGGAFIDTAGNNVGIAQALQGTGDLTKLGAGTLTLSGSNSFTGNINVEAGTLSLTEAFISSLATVSIESGAMLNLNFMGDNVIGALIVDGVNLGTGTFTSSESFLSGAGSLTVIPEPSTFAFLGGLLALGMVVICRRRQS